MGDFDFVPSVLERAGVRLLFSRINIQPGNRLLLAFIRRLWYLVCRVILSHHLFSSSYLSDHFLQNDGLSMGSGNH